MNFQFKYLSTGWVWVGYNGRFIAQAPLSSKKLEDEFIFQPSWNRALALKAWELFRADPTQLEK